MERYKVMAVSEEEYRKADTIPNYVPVEHQVGCIEADCEANALNIKNGTYPKGSQLTQE
jgi:hypothetical protein